MATKYDNADWSKCARTYGVLVVTIGPDYTAQGNEGVSLPCRGCYVQMRELLDIAKISIGTPADDMWGVELAPSGSSTQPLWVPVSDVAQLYFFGNFLTQIDIMYLLG